MYREGQRIVKNKPIIGIDGRMYSHSGIGRYIRMLVDHLGHNAKDGAYRFVVFSPERFFGNGFDHEKSRSRPLSLGEQFDLVRYNCAVGPNLLHSPQFNIPLLSGIPQVTTIHDCAYAKYPEEFTSPVDRLLHAVMFRAALQKSRKIIAVSQATKDDLVARFKISESKIRVIHEGVDESFRRWPDSKQMEAFKGRYGIEGDYVLFVGVARPRKNIERVLRAFATARKDLPQSLKLIIAGPEDRRFIDIRKRVQELGIADSVIQTGKVSDRELCCLYRSALCLVFPTLYEGFGLPILEAMASGTPVITSHRPAHTEVAGEAAMLIDPLSTEQLMEAIVMVVADKKLRQELAEKGLIRAGMFSWDRCAEQTLSLYDEVLNA